jgi:YidC/Oxa1 family membrane protein insertase
MDNYRAFLAIIISFVILLGYQYFFAGFGPKEVPADKKPEAAVERVAPPAGEKSVSNQNTTPSLAAAAKPKALDHDPKRIVVETDVYTAVFSELGGTLKSFIMKGYKETAKSDSPGKQLIKTEEKDGFPLDFTWGSAVGANLLYTSTTENVKFKEGEGKGQFVMHAVSDAGVEVERTYSFDRNQYLIDIAVKIKNTTALSLEGIPRLHQVNMPFEDSDAGSSYLFTGPAAFVGGQLQEYKSKEITESPKTVQGAIDWVAYEGTYFLCGILPEHNADMSLSMHQTGKIVGMALAGKQDILPPGGELLYKYRVYYGPKTLTVLKGIGANLDQSLNFGWFDVIAKPTLWLLNFFHRFVGNYGIAIILVTVLFKAIFWPITQKGMKSMKNMQKLQPKMVKIKEKYKNDPAQMNKEVMNLYKTYKVNPLGGCLPMVLQIPVFFALYKVLLQCIELRHAPFMLWITDLSAPDRLWIGFDIPYLGGIPVLTLLMGASMFIQQKLTPTTADPTQAKIMMFLPVVFTFMFINFASGLVLYWFVNNLLAILQQQIINRQQIKTVV